MSTNDYPNHTQLKILCMKCSTHFIICSNDPARYLSSTIYCPGCGQDQDEYCKWQEEVAKPIIKVVPGKATPIREY